ncbi:hypothetical protein CYMTET_12012, partial [Cymbomonas tetramitiformis]
LRPPPLGEGSQGTQVFRGFYEMTTRKQSRRPAAVKRIPIPAGERGVKTRQLVERELEYHGDLRGCLGVVQVLGHEMTADHIYIALELCGAGSLRQYLEEQAPGLAWERRVELARGAARVVCTLHARGFLHNDLKPDNLLVGNDGGLKVADVGLSVRRDEGAREGEVRAALAFPADGGSGGRGGAERDEAWAAKTAASFASFRELGIQVNMAGRAPELLAAGRPSTQTDVWALGCVFFFIFTGSADPFPEPCPGARHNTPLPPVGEPDLAALLENGCPPAECARVESLLRSMLAWEPRQRPSAAEVLEHPLFWSPEHSLSELVALLGRMKEVPGLREAPESEEAVGSPLARAAVAALGGEGSWGCRVPEALLKEKEEFSSYDAEWAADLVRFVRNVCEHPPPPDSLAWRAVYQVADTVALPVAGSLRPRRQSQQHDLEHATWRGMVSHLVMAVWTPELPLLVYEWKKYDVSRTDEHRQLADDCRTNPDTDVGNEEHPGFVWGLLSFVSGWYPVLAPSPSADSLLLAAHPNADTIC